MVRSAPGYWMFEASGVLTPVVLAYLRGDDLSPQDITIMRAYLRQWAFAGDWAPGPALDDLRRSVDGLTSRAAIEKWIRRAVEMGMDPL